MTNILTIENTHPHSPAERAGCRSVVVHDMLIAHGLISLMVSYGWEWRYRHIKKKIVTGQWHDHGLMGLMGLMV